MPDQFNDSTKNDHPPVKNIVLECIMAMVNDPVLNENKRLGKTKQSEKRIIEIITQFGLEPLFRRFYKGS